MAIQFQENYELLELEAGDDWATANANYRRLVHAWHPDRFTNQPRERVHAQQKFIELTKAFNNLRAFYRENNRLPFERIQHAVADSPVPPAHQRVEPEDQAVLESGILNKRKPSSKAMDSNRKKHWLWLIPAALTLFGGLFVFALFDRQAKMEGIEEAKRVLRDVEPSEFMTNKEEIKRSNNRKGIVRGEPVFK